MILQESDKKPVPIILIGMNRTGTKWVSNILCSHPGIIGIQSERARGILETNMFGIMQTKFDLSQPDEYLGLIELWSATEFFRLTGVEKGYFYQQAERPRSVFAVFELMMEQVACRAGKSFWLQKTSPLRAEGALRHFSNARIVLVRRNLLDTLRSTWRMNEQRGKRRIVRSTYAYVRQNKVLHRIARKHGAAEVSYDRLKGDFHAEVKRLFGGIGLDPSEATAPITFEKNTSFERDAQRSKIMSATERNLVRTLAFLVGLIPLVVIEAASSLRQRLGKQRPLPLMPGTFGPLFDFLKDTARK